VRRKTQLLKWEAGVWGTAESAVLAVPVYWRKLKCAVECRGAQLPFQVHTGVVQKEAERLGAGGHLLPVPTQLRVF